MSRISWALLVALMLAAILDFENHRASASAPREARADLTVSAAISMKNCLQDTADLYRSENRNVNIHLNLGSSGTLERQIEQGAPVDLFISASPAQMDSLSSRKLILPDTRKDLVRNAVVLIVPKDRTGITSFQDLAQRSVKIIAIGDPQSVPAGAYAQQVLSHFGLFEWLRPKFVFAKDVRQVLTYVETGNADAGIVYATDARTTSRVSVVATAPEDSHSRVVYPVAVVAGSKNPSAAKAFEDFLLTPKSTAVFERYGFTPPTK